MGNKYHLTTITFDNSIKTLRTVKVAINLNIYLLMFGFRLKLLLSKL